MVKKAQATVIDPVSNGAAELIEMVAPYTVSVTVEGTAAILFHRWNDDDVAEKAKAAKGSAIKKTDNLETYVWRMDDAKKKSHIALPGEYLRQAVINAAKYRQDPRSPRKSAMDLYKAGVVMLTELADLGTATWDFVKRNRVQIQRNAITRHRPGFNAGWVATFEIQVLLPEYISPQDLHGTIINAGRLVGVGDFRPTFGRFQVTNFKVQ